MIRRLSLRGKSSSKSVTSQGAGLDLHLVLPIPYFTFTIMVGPNKTSKLLISGLDGRCAIPIEERLNKEQVYS